MAVIVATNFIPGLKVEKIRTQKRLVAGLKGEEIIVRGTDEKKEETEINFVWEFLGEKNSAHHPWIKIDMNTEDGLIEEKIAVWDAILDSVSEHHPPDPDMSPPKDDSSS